MEQSYEGLKDYLGVAGNIVKEERSFMETHTLIKTGKTPHETLHALMLPKCAMRFDPSYGIQSLFLSLMLGLDSTNINLIEVYTLWEKIHEPDAQHLMFYYQRTWKLNGYIIHDIKYTIDMLIALTWWVSQKTVCDDIKVSSIGEYLKHQDKCFSVFDDFHGFFHLVNNIENAYKHSIPNIDIRLMGKDEPAIYAYHAPYNKNIFKPKLYAVSLTGLIQDFNKFYSFSLDALDQIGTKKKEQARLIENNAHP